MFSPADEARIARSVQWTEGQSHARQGQNDPGGPASVPTVQYVRLTSDQLTDAGFYPGVWCLWDPALGWSDQEPVWVAVPDGQALAGTCAHMPARLWDVFTDTGNGPAPATRPVYMVQLQCGPVCGSGSGDSGAPIGPSFTFVADEVVYGTGSLLYAVRDLVTVTFPLNACGQLTGVQLSSVTQDVDVIDLCVDCSGGGLSGVPDLGSGLQSLIPISGVNNCVDLPGGGGGSPGSGGSVHIESGINLDFGGVNPVNPGQAAGAYVVALSGVVSATGSPCPGWHEAHLNTEWLLLHDRVLSLAGAPAAAWEWQDHPPLPPSACAGQADVPAPTLMYLSSPAPGQAPRWVLTIAPGVVFASTDFDPLKSGGSGTWRWAGEEKVNADYSAAAVQVIPATDTSGCSSGAVTGSATCADAAALSPLGPGTYATAIGPSNTQQVWFNLGSYLAGSISAYKADGSTTSYNLYMLNSGCPGGPCVDVNTAGTHAFSCIGGPLMMGITSIGGDVITKVVIA